MATKKHIYQHIVSTLMVCSTMLGVAVPSTAALADNQKPKSQVSTKAQQSQNLQQNQSTVASDTNVSGQSMSVSQNDGQSDAPSNLASSNGATLVASSASSSNNSSNGSNASQSTRSSAQAVGNVKSYAKNTPRSARRDTFKNGKKDSATDFGQVTIKYTYDHKTVGEQSRNLYPGEHLDMGLLPSALRSEYRAASNQLFSIKSPRQVSATVPLDAIHSQGANKRTDMANHSSKVINFEPKRDYTPLPSRQYDEQRIEHTKVVNPMFRPDNAPRIHSASQYKQRVPMTSSDSPRDFKNVKPFKNFSLSVLRYKPYMDKVCQKYHMQHYEVLMLAIMQCETGGHGSDVMQSSESVGLSAGSLSPSQSIEQAVRYMSGIVHKAHELDHAEQHDHKIPKRDYHYYANDNRLLAQTYNYGGNFMDFVAKQKHGYTLKASQEYSKDVVAPRLGNSDGETYTYDNPISRMYHQTFLYTNGGNYFYGDLVEQYAVGGYMHTIMNHLIKYAGQKYAFGGHNLSRTSNGADLVSYGLGAVHVHMPGSIQSQWGRTHNVHGGLNASQPGDLVFFKGDHQKLNHVGFLMDRHTMFSSDNHSIGFHNLDNGYWRKNIVGIRRIPEAHKLNAQFDHDLNKLAAEAAKGSVPKSVQMRLGALNKETASDFTTSPSTTTTENSGSGEHFLGTNAPSRAKKYLHSPRRVGMRYGVANGWSDPGDQCVNFANSYFRAIWGQHRDFVMGNGIDMATAWSQTMHGHVSDTPHAGAIASTSAIGLTGGDPAGHTFVVQHVYKNGDILVAEENWPGESGSDNATDDDWDYAILPSSVVSGNTQYFMPNTHDYHLKWRR